MQNSTNIFYFRPKKSSDPEYVSIKDKGASQCRAVLGFAEGQGAHSMYLPHNCPQVSTTAHEFIHILGFYHEHQRPDRDDYIWVDESNLKASWRLDIRKCNSCKTFDVPYDPHSIMHYEAKVGCIDCSRLVLHSKVSVVDGFKFFTMPLKRDF